MKKFKSITFLASTFLLTACLSDTPKVADAPSPPVSNKDGAPTKPSPTPSSNPPPVVSFDLKAQVEDYKQRYGLRDPYTKLVDNQGNGFNELYGARNVRVVLHGVYYRGGANNKYNKYSVRSNSNPLQSMGLTNLCQQGFSDSIYLYSENYATAPTSVSCRNQENQDAVLAYKQITGLTRGNEEKHLTLVHQHIKGARKGPMYAHCWNGWHASGYVAAITLKQFCGWSASEADAYWVKNTDGNSVGYDSIRKRVRDFVPLKNLTITNEERELICP